MSRIIFPVLFCVALLTSPVMANAPRLADGAPDTHVVQTGDTLWGIAARFLRDPWRWPEVWRVNRDEIANPHRIYPGQIIVLDRSGPYLTLGRRVGEPEFQRLSPREYQEPARLPISSIPQEVIEPFLIRPLVIDDRHLQDSATLVATEERIVLIGTGDRIFARDIDDSVRTWQIYRPARAIVDPVGGETLGYEARFLGTARVVRGEVNGLTTLEIASVVEEIEVGDRLLPADQPALISYIPHPPLEEIEGHVLEMYDGYSIGGRGTVVALALGEYDGVEPGHVLALFRNRGEATYRSETGTERFALPDDRYGLVFVFRVFDRVSYALVMDASGPVRTTDLVRSPDYRP